VTTRLCLIRHGETDWNASHRIQGQLNIPLNENGRIQALSLGALSDNNFDAIYSSDLNRAYETARMLAGDAEVVALPSLRERHHGLFQGLTASEAALRYPEEFCRHKSRDPDYDLETGESLMQFALRVGAALDALAKRHEDQTIAIVTHAGVLDVIYRKATGKPLNAPRDFTIRNCTLNWFRHDPDGFHLDSWDERTDNDRIESTE
jgi:2,3-bisphosphoglycerate-dependent phosphoglycerate mutase